MFFVSNSAVGYRITFIRNPEICMRNFWLVVNEFCFLLKEWCWRSESALYLSGSQVRTPDTRLSDLSSRIFVLLLDQKIEQWFQFNNKLRQRWNINYSEQKIQKYAIKKSNLNNYIQQEKYFIKIKFCDCTSRKRFDCKWKYIFLFLINSAA